MPYFNRSEEYVKSVLECWNDLTSRRSGKKNKKLFTQVEVADFIEELYGEKISVRTIKNWNKGVGLDRGQGVGQERGDYNTLFDRKEYKKHYYEANQDIILEKKRQQITCECGCIIRKDFYTKHRQTKKHINLMKPTDNLVEP